MYRSLNPWEHHLVKPRTLPGIIQPAPIIEGAFKFMIKKSFDFKSIHFDINYMAWISALLDNLCGLMFHS